MQMATRRLVNRAFTAASFFSIIFMGAALVILLFPIVAGGIKAFFFFGTVEFREAQFVIFGQGDPEAMEEELARAEEARRPLFDRIQAFREKLEKEDARFESKYRAPFEEFCEAIHGLLGPLPGAEREVMKREMYGAPRWDRVKVRLKEAKYTEKWAPESDEPGAMLVQKFVPRRDDFEGSGFESVFDLLTEENAEKMLLPEFTFYWRFIVDESDDAHFFGGIGEEVFGTVLLTVGAMIFSIPMGVVAAIYLAEYSKDSTVVSLLRSCISTLAGVPSIVFGLFGLAFFLGWLNVPKSVFAGSMTLGLLVLPTIIRASEEAIRAVPQTYKEASMGLGASHWRTICTVLIPAALPGILTGIVISMGRAAGETAPIIFTAAVSYGDAPGFDGYFTEPTPALPWNVYNLTAEHRAIEQIEYVQYGMVLVLLAVVLALNLLAIYMRARISKKLRG